MVKCPTSAKVMISGFMSSSLASGSLLSAQSLFQILSLSLPLPCLYSLPLSKLSKHYYYTIQYNTIQYNTIQYNTIQYTLNIGWSLPLSYCWVWTNMAPCSGSQTSCSGIAYEFVKNEKCKLIGPTQTHLLNQNQNLFAKRNLLANSPCGRWDKLISGLWYPKFENL